MSSASSNAVIGNSTHISDSVSAFLSLLFFSVIVDEVQFFSGCSEKVLSMLVRYYLQFPHL